MPRPGALIRRVSAAITNAPAGKGEDERRGRKEGREGDGRQTDGQTSEDEQE